MAKEKAKEKAKKEPKSLKPEKEPKKKAPIKINPILKLEKNVKVELQNYLFGTSEKKLMVSEDFLNEMTVKYISKRMSIINTSYVNMHTTRSAVNFFKYTAEIEKLIEDLIGLEKYYPFKNPVPSVYKRNYLAHKPTATTEMIARIWKHATQKHPIKEGTAIEDIEPKIVLFYDNIISDLISQREHYSEYDMELIDSYYIQIHGEPLEPPHVEPELEESNESVEALEEGIEEGSTPEEALENEDFELDLNGNEL